MSLGADDYLIKPIDVVQFLKAVDDWMRKKDKSNMYKGEVL